MVLDLGEREQPNRTCRAKKCVRALTWPADALPHDCLLEFRRIPGEEKVLGQAKTQQPWVCLKEVLPYSFVALAERDLEFLKERLVLQHSTELFNHCLAMRNGDDIPGGGIALNQRAHRLRLVLVRRSESGRSGHRFGARPGEQPIGSRVGGGAAEYLDELLRTVPKKVEERIDLLPGAGEAGEPHLFNVSGSAVTGEHANVEPVDRRGPPNVPDPAGCGAQDRRIHIIEVVEERGRLSELLLPASNRSVIHCYALRTRRIRTRRPNKRHSHSGGTSPSWADQDPSRCPAPNDL